MKKLKSSGNIKKRMESKIDMLNREIDQSLTEMEMWYPELFRYLEETPVSPATDAKNITEADLKNYLESLRSQMATFCRTHGKSSQV